MHVQRALGARQLCSHRYLHGSWRHAHEIC